MRAERSVATTICLSSFIDLPPTAAAEVKTKIILDHHRLVQFAPSQWPVIRVEKTKDLW